MSKEVFVKIHLSEENNYLNKLALEIARKAEAARAAAKPRVEPSSSSVRGEQKSLPG